MKGSIKLVNILGIEIRVHITFLILPLLFYLYGGIRGLFLILTVFVFVTMHELTHSLVARHHGIKVPDITLLPIGGVASMAGVPKKPSEELKISIAGPLLNIVLAILLFYPMYRILGREAFFTPSLDSWKQTLAYLFWINPILAIFNLLPAFPMDGGRVLRSILAQRFGIRKATEIAVSIGHAFALFFGFVGILYGHIILVIIAVFIYMAASGEGAQVQLKETLKNFRVDDILPDKFLTLREDMRISKVLEIIFHKRQEDFPVVTDDRLVGLVTRVDIISAMHKSGVNKQIGQIMHREFPVLKPEHSLMKAHALMQQSGLRALPVVREGKVLGIISTEDLGRIYNMMSNKT
jgi:Zn-dependent protease/CBS domain-containing protein